MTVSSQLDTVTHLEVHHTCCHDTFFAWSYEPTCILTSDLIRLGLGAPVLSRSPEEPLLTRPRWEVINVFPQPAREQPRMVPYVEYA